MIEINIRANGVPRTVHALPGQNIGDFLTANGLSCSKTALYINEVPISPSIEAMSFMEAGISGSALIKSVMKTSNA